MIGMDFFRCGWARLSLLLLLTMKASLIRSEKQPNIIFINTDDWGFADISARGCEFHTPNLDALYYESINLNYHYVHTLCSTSRATLLTGVVYVY